jgi:hypothetical protein
VRLWLKLPLAVPPPTPSGVCGGGLLPELNKIGFTFYHLNALQDAMPTHGPAVVEVDVYNAAPLLPQEDGALVNLCLRALAAACPASFQSLAPSDVEDFAVVSDPFPPPFPPSPRSAFSDIISPFFLCVCHQVRVPAAVSHFAPGCFKHLPPLLAPSLGGTFAFAGDWVDRGGQRSWSHLNSK